MRQKKLLTDDDAVSPVIGVILMVSITVILAAVVASFVLGMGDTAASTNPQASFGFEYDIDPGNNTEGVLTITHTGGDTITGSSLYVRGEGLTDSTEGSLSSSDYDLGKNTNNDWESVTGTSEVSAGKSVAVAARSDYDLNVVYETAEGDQSATLGHDLGPEA